MMNAIPWALTLSRAAAAAALLVAFYVSPRPAYFGACLIVAVVSDYFDGVIARRLGVATEALRRADSVVDTVFYLCAAFVAWRLYPEAIRAHAAGLWTLAALEAVRYLVDALKFGREASYHMYSSKLWGLTLFLAFFALLVYGRAGRLLAAAIYLGILADLEGLAISAILPVWAHDVPTVVAAWKRRS